MKNSLLKLLFEMVLDPQVDPIAWTIIQTHLVVKPSEPSYGFSVGFTYADTVLIYAPFL